MSWWKKVVYFFTPLSSEELPNPLKEKEEVVETELVRARNKKGRYVADDLQYTRCKRSIYQSQSYKKENEADLVRKSNYERRTRQVWWRHGS